MCSDVNDLRTMAQSDDLPRARELLGRGLTRYRVNCMDSKGQTPLFYACSEGHLEMVRMLVSEFQADTAIRDNEGYTAVMVADLGGHSRVVEALVDEYHVSVRVKDRKGQTLLHHVCAGGNVNLVKTLALKYESGVNAKDDQNDTPLHLVVKRKRHCCYLKSLNVLSEPRGILVGHCYIVHAVGVTS